MSFRLIERDLDRRYTHATHSGFGDLAELRASSLNDGLEVLQRLLGLLDNTAGYDLHRGGIERDASRAEQEVADFDALRVGPDGCGRFCSCINNEDKQQQVSTVHST